MRWPWQRKRSADASSSRSSQSRVKARYDRFSGELSSLDDELRAYKQMPKREGNVAASGSLIRHGQASYLRRLIMPWQIRAFGYYDLLGEIKYASQFYSRALANLILVAAEKNEDGELVPTENEEVIAAVKRIKDPGGGGRAGLLADYGRLMFLVGESLLFVSREALNTNEGGSPAGDPEFGLEKWEMLSTDELRTLDGSYTRFMAPSLPAMNFKPAPDNEYVPVKDNEAVAYRLHRRHPRFSSLPDATLEGALDICEELVLLTQVVRARARSRMATAGILFIDERITTRPDEPSPDEDPLEDPFLEDLTEALTSPITDEGTAAAVVPLIARIKVPDGVKMADLVYHLQIVDPMQIYPETGLRMEAIRRLAIVLDMPPEVLLGTATVNHWNAWMVDEQSWKVHLQPVAQGLVEDLTSAYLQPYLREQNVENWDMYFIDYDASKVINHPDRTKDAKDLHQALAISDEALRDAGGFDEDAAIKDEKELARRVGIAVRDSSLAWDGIPSVKAGGIEPEPGEILSGQSGGDVGTPQGAAKGNEVVKGAPASGPPDEQVTAAVLLAAQIEGLAHAALIRAREGAGSRLRTLARRSDLEDVLDGVPNRDIASTLGRTRTRTLTKSDAELVGYGRELIVTALSAIGVEDEGIALTIADAIEKHAARTLFDPFGRSVLMPGTFANYVRGLLLPTNGDREA